MEVVFVLIHFSSGKPLLLSLTDNAYIDPLRAMKSRTSYANLRGDLLVGWHTSALEPITTPSPEESLDIKLDFRHILKEEFVQSHNVDRLWINGKPETSMSLRLKQLGWRRVTVSFHVRK